MFTVRDRAQMECFAGRLWRNAVVMGLNAHGSNHGAASRLAEKVCGGRACRARMRGWLLFAEEAQWPEASEQAAGHRGRTFVVTESVPTQG